MALKGRILQRAELYFQKEGENEARHVTTWEAYTAICAELKEGTGIDYLKYENRIFLKEQDFPIKGNDIKEWPEKESQVGPGRLFFCVHPDCDFTRIKNLESGKAKLIIQTYGTTHLPEQGKHFLDKAEKYGLKVLYCIKSHVHDLLIHHGYWDRDECERIVGRFDSHPALWGYYLLDEPDAGEEDPKVGVSMELQREIHDAFRGWTDKPLVIALRGGTRGWHLIDFSLWKIIANYYVFDGTGHCWGEEPLEALKGSAKQIQTFRNEHDVDFLGFMFQSSSHPATGHEPPLYGTKVPLGEIENQFNVLNEFELFPKLVAMYGWNGGDFDPMRNDEIYEEIKALFNKIK